MSERGKQGGFRDLRVVAKVVESRIITSLHLEPLDPATWVPFEAGQFLVLRVPANGTRRAMPRSYSVSSPPAASGRYRISVKREAAPGPGIPDGAGSCWLHDEVSIGDIIAAAGPRGEFFLDRASDRPVALLSGGVGLTPMVSMLHALADPGERRPVHFIHACDNGEVHALGDEVMSAARQRDGIGVHFCYRFPTTADRAASRFHSDGVLSRELLETLMPAADRDYYLCGPPPFMKAVYGILRAQGVQQARIKYEFFGPATVLEADVEAAAPVASDAPSPAKPGPKPPAPMVRTAARDWIDLGGPPEASGPPIEFRASGKSLAWDPKADSLLAFAEAAGLKPEFSCRAGVCGTCKTRLISGEVVYTEEPLDPPGEGHVLICCAKPHGPVVLDL